MISPAATMPYDYPHPVSRTYQYKKITKPLLERKRRARINRCLDELKNIMVDALETERENISKLEKADILELTVRHLQRLQTSRPSGLSATGADGISAENRWQCGFGHCAAEACRFLSSLSGEAAERLARHLASGLQTSRQPNSPMVEYRDDRILHNFERSLSLSLNMEKILPKIDLLSPRLTNDIAGNTSSGTVDISDQMDSVVHRANLSPITSTSCINNKHIDEAHDTNVSTKIVSMPQCRASISPIHNRKKLTESFSTKLKISKDQEETATTMITTRNKSCNSQDLNIEDDEEIDVEHVEERNTIWRPW